MINFDNYLKWKESELKEYLDKQPQYRRKSIVLYQGWQFDEDADEEIEVKQLAEIFGRSGDTLLIKTECNSIYKVDITDIGRYYVSCASATSDNGISANVEISKDLDALKKVKKGKTEKLEEKQDS